MFPCTVKIAGVATLFAACAMLVPSAVQAQAPPMDMSWGIQSQIQNFNRGQAAANHGAWPGISSIAPRTSLIPE